VRPSILSSFGGILRQRLAQDSFGNPQVLTPGITVMIGLPK
jgi:hypothetical protein